MTERDRLIRTIKKGIEIKTTLAKTLVDEINAKTLQLGKVRKDIEKLELMLKEVKQNEKM